MYSEAFPKIEKKSKILHHSDIHDILLVKNVKLELDDIYYREINVDDIKELILLHKEWLPINYDETFFKNRISKKNVRDVMNLGACIKIGDFEHIIGAIFCEIKNDYNHCKEYAPFELCSRSCLETCFCQSIELCYIMTIGVIDECRRIGLGSKLLQEFDDMLLNKRPNCKGVYLHVIDYNKVAIKFYSKNSFKEVNTIRNYYNIMDDIYDAIILFRIYEDKEKNEMIKSTNKEGFFKTLLRITVIGPIQGLFCCTKGS